MMGRSHRILGALAGATYATTTGQPPSMVVLTALVATTTSNGPTSPDGDQTGQWWPALTGILPTWVRRHRGLLHWWGLPFAAWFLVPHLPTEAHWVGYALIVGWASHLFGDALFGRIPLAPWGCTWGVGLDTDGPLESGVRILGWRTPSALRVVLLTALAYVLIVGTRLDLPAAGVDLAQKIGAA